MYAGGWCDLDYWSGDADGEVITEAPGADEPLALGALAAVLNRFEGLFQNSG